MTFPKKQLGEFQLIARLCAGLGPGPRTILGPGDDCAILASGRRPLLLTIDSMVEDVHFRIPWFPAKALGYKALTVNLSDIAAMGGQPVACVVNLAIRNGLEAVFFDQLYRGLRTAASASQTAIVGGNITRARVFAITIAVVGETRGVALRRDSARAGDDIFVTGTLGDAAAGLRILEGRLRAHGQARRFLVKRFVEPAARLAAGKCLSVIRPAPAAIDISDGLLQDLAHILERSGVAAEINCDAIPLSPAYRAVTAGDIDLALRGGEDYELLFCTRPGTSEAALSRRLGLAVRRIGRIVKGRGTIELVGRRGLRAKTPLLSGFDQLRSRKRG